MKLGIIADTHDHVPMVKKAVDVFNDAEVDLVVHAGDYVSPFSLKPFFALESDFVGVWGNNDGDKIALQKMAQGKIENSPFIETWDKNKILIGHHFETLETLIASQEFYLIIYGHTHKSEIRQAGKTLIINPGECGGWVEGKSTIAVADLETQRAEIIELT
jgi:putative phosphoesterase